MKRYLFVVFTSVWLIATFALVMRVTFLWTQQSRIPHQVLATVPFEHEAGNIASALVQGRGFSDVFRQPTGPTAWLAPVYPWILSLIFRCFGAFTFASFLAAALFNCVCSAAVCFPLYALGRRFGGPLPAALAAWLWAIYPHGVMMPFAWIWDTSLSALLATTLLWATLELLSSRKQLHWIGYGLLWGLSLLTNPALGALLPFFLGWLFFRGRNVNAPAGRLAAVSLVIVILVCLPWTVRNYHQFHKFIPLRSNFPFELWIGNNDIFDESAVGGTQRITRFGEARLYAQLGEAQFMSEKWRIASVFIRTHPALFYQLTEKRIITTWTGTETPFSDFFKTDSALVRFIFGCNFLVLAGTIAGIFLLALRGFPYRFPVIAAVIVFPLIYYVTHTSLRYRHPLDPIFLLLVAISLLAPFSKSLSKPI